MPTQWTPSARELDDLELILVGALDDMLAIRLPEDVAASLGDHQTLELTDPEGLPLAELAIDNRSGDVVRGGVSPLSHPEFGAFRRYHRSPREVRDKHAGTPTVAVPVSAPMTLAAIEAVNEVAKTEQAVPLLLVLVGTGSPEGVSAPALVRSTLAAAEQVPGAEVVAVALARRDTPEEDAELRDRVALAFSDEVLHLPAPEGALALEVQRIVEHDRPPHERRGLVVFFTGFSGSGKSTLARALHDVLLERGDRTVTSLDGDVVRRHLSAGLGFSREDRETNIRRIGWVAAEISRHGGLAICSPIAPFDSTRREVRAMVEAAGGGFVLVHVSTPIEECERRDRKGLYAKARAGEIPDFTGISSPYDVPEDATVTVDTTGRSIEAALDDVLRVLDVEGWLPDQRTTPETGPRPAQ
ncbi:MAG TPA: adenylyl-sulfate kinase [Nocardioidaceae bacterium]|nr:adenylyl-sulfate kinase [Nocardioidaceae bacterium]